MCLDHPQTIPLNPSPSSMKSLPGAKKVGDHFSGRWMPLGLEEIGLQEKDCIIPSANF